VALQKKLQGGPAGSPHSASPALNAFHLSAWMPLQVHPANIRAGNFLFTAIADGGISLVPYPPFRRVDICNLAYGVEWHGVSLSRFENRSRLYTIAPVCTSTEGISRARRSHRSEDNGPTGEGVEKRSRPPLPGEVPPACGISIPRRMVS
jgi:hypothetical protein